MSREKFEKLDEIEEIIKNEKAIFIGDGYRVRGDAITEGYLDGAWYAWQEQQKRIDNVSKYLVDSCGFDKSQVQELLK